MVAMPEELPGAAEILSFEAGNIIRCTNPDAPHCKTPLIQRGVTGNVFRAARVVSSCKCGRVLTIRCKGCGWEREFVHRAAAPIRGCSCQIH